MDSAPLTNHGKQLQALMQEDTLLFNRTLAETLRLSAMAKSGNVRAWKKWQKEQEVLIDGFCDELDLI